MKNISKFALGAAFAAAFSLAAAGGTATPARAASKTENFLLGTLVGVAATAVIVSAAKAEKKRRKARRRARRVRYYHPEPWTPEWYDYCSARYRSFNPDTGYYRTYSGRYRFCR